MLLPEAFRSLSRLSSALSAKASTLCSFLLDLAAHSVAPSWPPPLPYASYFHGGFLLNLQVCIRTRRPSPAHTASDVLIFVSFGMRFSRYVSRTAFLSSCLPAAGFPASGDGEIRTLDPLLARQVLSQLSYTPTDAGLPSFEAIPFLILFFRLSQADGLKWTRTTDLTLIRRAL